MKVSEPISGEAPIVLTCLTDVTPELQAVIQQVLVDKLTNMPDDLAAETVEKYTIFLSF
jgi:hypothetical protein